MITTIQAIRIIKRKVFNLFKEFKECKSILDICKYLSAQDVTLIYIELPNPGKIKNLSAFEIERIKNWIFNFNHIEDNLPQLKKIYGDDIDSQYITALFDGSIVVNDGSHKRILDFCNEYVHIINGIRSTVGQPIAFKNKVYTFGACTVRGTGVEDSQTIASYLQKGINDLFPNTYCVVNMGIGRGSTIQDDYEQMKEQKYIPGDIVIWLPNTLMDISKLPVKLQSINNFYAFETSSLFERPHLLGEWFTDEVFHTNKIGNKALADFLFKKIVENKILNRTPKDIISSNQDGSQNITLTHGKKIYADNSELQKYIKMLKNYKIRKRNALIGCIVMNCNPFTNGHKYLIEYASSHVDFLYIFVVEENKSYFSFEDRFELIKQGIACLKNVKVLPSGKFIISALTFPGYFYKDSLKNAVIDCSNDVNIFAQHIAPALNIRVRFAGEEPLDPITNQYNQAMAEILPRFSIKFEIIQRKENNGQVISASRVRKCFENGNLSEIKELVPLSTYDYLLKCYKRKYGELLND